MRCLQSEWDERFRPILALSRKSPNLPCPKIDPSRSGEGRGNVFLLTHELDSCSGRYKIPRDALGQGLSERSDA